MSTSSVSIKSSKAAAIKSAITYFTIPPSNGLFEIELPLTQQLNKAGSGSLQDSLEIEDLNIQFAQELKTQLRKSSGMDVVMLCPAGSSQRFIKTSNSPTLKSLRLNPPPPPNPFLSLFSSSPPPPPPPPPTLPPNTLYILLTPSSPSDYTLSSYLSLSSPLILLNGYLKTPSSIKNAKWIYHRKPLTNGGLVSGHLLNEGEGFKVVNAEGDRVIKVFKDEDIIVKNSNTPDLREAVKLAQVDMDDRINRGK
ncbi:hypothetical protein TrVE_jg10578 [Triparma verrucosa]|uniref:Uncharacterized protein n=1 Tax=Triparma verrucosa TaxID=1606542 RepID=A0A9W7B0J4_9STRA|nr:hypothetical protein TrVE_jg10578 [Triparma verrucosa]